MPMGHTERSTINKRRKLTEHQIAMLDRLVVGPVRADNQNTPQKNVIRSLDDRGLVEYHRREEYWRLTPAGWDAAHAPPGTKP